MIYFDHNATAPYSPSVREYIRQGILEDWGNPSSIYPPSQVLGRRIRECGSFAAKRLNCPPKSLFWTSGGTESINTILSLETLKLNQLSGFITSPLEHHATLKKLECLSQKDLFARKGQNEGRLSFSRVDHSPKVKICWAGHNEQGEIDLNSLDEICSQNPRSLLSFLSSNNETGAITDIKAISKIAKKHGCLLHVDAVQSLGKEPLDLDAIGADFASFSGHKIGAMKGIGLLYARKPFAPLMHGGRQERGMRPGTYNFPAIYSFKLAVQDISLSRQKEVQQLRGYFEKRLKSLFAGDEGGRGLPGAARRASGANEAFAKEQAPFFKINCEKARRLPNTSNIYCGGGASNQQILFHLARKGICVSSGSACHAGSPAPSHVIASLAAASQGASFGHASKRYDSGPHADYANACIRLSFAPSNTKAEVDFLIQSLKEFYASPLWEHSPLRP